MAGAARPATAVSRRTPGRRLARRGVPQSAARKPAAAALSAAAAAALLGAAAGAPPPQVPSLFRLESRYPQERRFLVAEHPEKLFPWHGETAGVDSWWTMIPGSRPYVRLRNAKDMPAGNVFLTASTADSVVTSDAGSGGDDTWWELDRAPLGSPWFRLVSKDREKLGKRVFLCLRLNSLGEGWGVIMWHSVDGDACWWRAAEVNQTEASKVEAAGPVEYVLPEEERRLGPDGILYTKREFLEYFGSLEVWDNTPPIEHRRAMDGIYYTRQEFLDFFGDLQAWDEAAHLVRGRRHGVQVPRAERAEL
ncbi:unnamed protein product [Prorocentrum cordatum]|uniref:Uncharacterized protein n=1 Tax=Prorocentrum cordatum TaxID=2364126 RepID=A0ABN9RFT0_9DINO|nr:unnamed protein product [Polarella glacialis]